MKYLPVMFWYFSGLAPDIFESRRCKQHHIYAKIKKNKSPKLLSYPNLVQKTYGSNLDRDIECHNRQLEHERAKQVNVLNCPFRT